MAELTDDQRTILENFTDSLAAEVTILVSEPWVTQASPSPTRLTGDILLTLDEMSSKVNERELQMLRTHVTSEGWTLVEVPGHNPVIDWTHGEFAEDVALHMLTTPGLYHTLRLGRVTADGARHVETDYAFASHAPRPTGPYDAACDAAADAQGITAIANALRALEIDVEVEQTGGFCMVAYVRPEGGPIIALSNDGPILVCVYLSEEAEMDGRFDVLHKFETEQEAAAKVAEILKGLT